MPNNTSHLDAADLNSKQPKSWREQIKVHPAADLFPMMSNDELKALGEDIKENGLKTNIAVWQAAIGGGDRPRRYVDAATFSERVSARL
jgi:hypothetical protein